MENDFVKMIKRYIHKKMKLEFDWSSLDMCVVCCGYMLGRWARKHVDKTYKNKSNAEQQRFHIFLRLPSFSLYFARKVCNIHSWLK